VEGVLVPVANGGGLYLDICVGVPEFLADVVELPT